ncbi:hypothetical protein PR202_ga11780 [Eleusine coracana subsp. coracana]|uniref:Inhibitor I9 domain-containing protein n=1 Tax=Eleusine coracana subsp. coracana TaxID=191504 RepID=A0AAV5CAC1_ELECO|nr:hypothetical protein PR202_ga11780 [Eleusine coracana subsp. coracana]
MWRRGERCVILLAVAAAALLVAAAAGAGRDDRSTYIVHMSHSAMPNDFVEHGEWYAASLQSVSDSATVLYTYDTLVHGYSARLTRAEAEALEQQPGVLLVNPEVRYELHTTRTPEFLGLDGTDALFPQSGTGSDVTVGVLDTGVWPERPSYDDTGFGPVPAGWKGKCEEGPDFNASACNKKLIGARFFLAGYEAAKGPVDVTKESRSPRATTTGTGPTPPARPPAPSSRARTCWATRRARRKAWPWLRGLSPPPCRGRSYHWARGP